MKAQEQIPKVDQLDECKQSAAKPPFFATNRGKLISAMIFILIIAVVMVSRIASGGVVTYALDDTKLGVICMDFDPVFIEYTDITAVEMLSTFAMGQALDVWEWDSGWCGVYENETFGEYTLFAYSSVGAYILVRSDQQVLVFNVKDADQTEKAYQALSERMAQLAAAN